VLIGSSVQKEVHNMLYLRLQFIFQALVLIHLFVTNAPRYA